MTRPCALLILPQQASVLSEGRFASVEAAAWNAVAAALWPARDSPSSEVSSAAVLDALLIHTTTPSASDLCDAYELFGQDWGPTDKPAGWFWPGSDECGSGPAVLATQAGLVVLDYACLVAADDGCRLALLGRGAAGQAEPNALVDLGPLCRAGRDALAALGSVAALLAEGRRLAVPDAGGCWRLDLP